MTDGRRDIAIIGMSCLFPKAPHLAAFWENILAGVDAISEPPEGSWTHAVHDPDSVTNDRLYTKRGGSVGDLARFDPLAFGVMPKAVDGAEPEQFIALQLAKDALADAGYADRPFDRRRAGIILGRGTYVNRGVISCFQHTIVIDQVLDILKRLHPEHPPALLDDLRRELKATLPPFNPENSPGLAHSVLVGRIANRLDLMGPAFTIDAACASSLLAVDYGIRDLMHGSCDMVLAGGIQVSTTHPIALLFTQLGALARSGTVRPFHGATDGTLLGEGAGIVVLKRRADAERDGDRIYAVVRALGTSSDGRAMGVLAPRVEGEELAMRRAYEGSGIDPATIGLIEAHGTGTPVGDEVEIESLRRIFPAGDGRPRLPIGSVKSMIGHCIPAAAAAGLIKTALAVHHRILPPTLHADAPHPKLRGSGLYLNAAPRPWIHPGPHPRRAGVSAFGFGGINAHAILEEAPLPEGRRTLVSVPGAPAVAADPPAMVADPGPVNVHARRDSEILVLAAADRDALRARALLVAAFIERNPDVELASLARTLARAERGGDGIAPLTLVAATADEARRKLVWAAGRLADPACRRIKEIGGIFWFDAPLAKEGGLALLFPGEGAQYPGMLEDLCRHFPEARAWFDLMDRAFRDHPRGFLPSQMLFPPLAGLPDAAPGAGADAGATARRDDAHLFEMDVAIESVFAANQAMLAILSRLGLRADAVVGHSTGEYSALIAAGAVEVTSDEALIDSILEGNRATERAMAQGKVPRGVLLAVGPAAPDVLLELTERGDLHLAMDNCPHQAVVCGGDQAIAAAEAALKARGAICQRLPFERAYHTPLFEPVTEELRSYYATGRFRAPRTTLYSCATAAAIPPDGETVRRLALEQWARPVRFRETIEAMHRDGVRLFVEVGPRGNLTAFVGDTLRGRSHLAVASNVTARSGMTQLHHLLAMLVAHGVSLDLAPLYDGRRIAPLTWESIAAGATLAAGARRAQPLPMNLPFMRLDDAFVARFAAASASPGVPAPAPVPVPVGAIAPAAAPGSPLSLASATAPAAAAAPDRRDAVMREYLRTMEQFLRTQASLAQAVVGARAGAAVAPAPAGSLPLLGEVVRRDAGGAVHFRRVLRLEDEVFLRDHTLGGRVSEDPTLTALPVLPLAMSLEIMAEAAAAIVPGLVPAAIVDVRVSRWIPFETGAVRLEIEANPRHGRRVDVLLRAGPEGEAAPPQAPAVQASVLLAEAPAPPPAATPLPEDVTRPSRYRPEALYAENQQHGMFHGPTLRGVAALERMGPSGAEAQLRSLPSAPLFRARPDARFLIDPIGIDVVSQVLGYWTAENLNRAFVVFPFAIDRVDLHAPPPAPPALSVGRVRCRTEGTDRVRADFEVLDGAGRARLRLAGWQVKRIDLPEILYAFRLAPRDVILSRQTPARLPGNVVACRLELPLDFMDADGGVWWDCLAHFVLSRRERQTWRTVGGAKRRREWLMGRVAAKDAVRHFLINSRGLAAFPADIEITSDPHGRPAPGGAFLNRLGLSLSVSIAHTDGVAMALAAEPALGVGIDIERVDRRRGEFERAAFNPEELRLLGEGSEADRRERALRLWCAKEAVAKAIGRGLMGSPLNLLAGAADEGLNRIDLRLAGSLLAALPHLATATLTARVDREGDLIVATSLSDV
ncbi:MAG TPA: beta-ketoacyl synthase N-terminal-like domain-containing protein [Dongiaceae bacterium]|nr:beta-ketoacyl synthase N-terminal-like domain-containing protein [Dongiaceae bacterium]